MCVRFKHIPASSETTEPSAKTEGPLQKSRFVDEFIRVDHAGELGADRIYAGQMAILGSIRHIFRKFPILIPP